MFSHVFEEFKMLKHNNEQNLAEDNLQQNL